jgi:hypothetical protein
MMNTATDYQSGDELHFEGALNEHFPFGLATGVGGYYFQQLTADGGSRDRVGAFRGRVTAIGPFLSCTIKAGTQEVTLSGRWFHEFDAKMIHGPAPQSGRICSRSRAGATSRSGEARHAAELAAARERQQKAALEQQQRQAAELAAEQERRRQAGASCDQMAANPSDVRKTGDVAGVPYNDLKTHAKAAADACALAMRVNPEEIRYRYQYARALEIDDPKKALKIHEQLIHDGYPASYDNAGSILIGTYKKIPEAIKYFNEGVRRGDPDSMVSLTSLIDQHYLFKDNPSEAKYALLTRAAELGHPGAKLAHGERARKIPRTPTAAGVSAAATTTDAATFWPFHARHSALMTIERLPLKHKACRTALATRIKKLYGVASRN